MDTKLRRFGKKSLSGLFTINNEHTDLLPKPDRATPPPDNDMESVRLEEFGMCGKDDYPAKKDSPSRRERIMGSLRRLRSNLDASKATSCAERPVQQDHPSPKSGGTRPSLMLNFDVSPPNKPIFDPDHASYSPSSLIILHSSPITVPTSTKENFPGVDSTGSGITSFQVGTVPTSPAPLQKPSVQQSIINNARRDVSSNTLTDKAAFIHIVDDNPTPMPGTHLSLQANSPPEILISPASSCSDYFCLDTASHREAEKAINVNAPGSRQIERKISWSPHNVFPWDTESSIPVLVCRAGSEEGNRGSETNTIDSLKASSDVSAYLAFSASRGSHGTDSSSSERRRNTWRRHTGLYDGTGYGSSNESMSSSPPQSQPELSDADKERARIVTAAIEKSIHDIDEAYHSTPPHDSRVENQEDKASPANDLEARGCTGDPVQIDPRNIENDDTPSKTYPKAPPSFEDGESSDRDSLSYIIISTMTYCPEIIGDEADTKELLVLDGEDSDESGKLPYSESEDEVKRDVRTARRIMDSSLGG